MADLEFRRDLFRGPARYHERFRAPYPQSLIDDLAQRSEASGQGRLLDLACGTGQLSFAWHGRVRREMLACAPAGRLRQVIEFGYELARRPG